MSNNTYKIFAYGNLINKASLTRTVPEARNIVPVATYGLKRVFNLASTYRFDEEQQAPVCVLSAEACESDRLMNGICFEMDEVSLDSLLERESGYDFCRIEAHHYDNPNDVFEAFYFRAKPSEPYRFLQNSSAQQHYLKLCLSGSAIFGQQFVEGFKNSTEFWGIDCEQTRDAIWAGDF